MNVRVDLPGSRDLHQQLAEVIALEQAIDHPRLVLGLRCSWCPGSAPMPKLLGLYALPPARRQGAAL